MEQAADFFGAAGEQRTIGRFAVLMARFQSYPFSFINHFQYQTAEVF